MTSRTNWAGNLTYGAARVVEPKSLTEAQETVRSSPKLRVVGSRHCFNDIADTPGTHLVLGHLNRILSIDTAKRSVTVEGGIRYSELGPTLHAAGLDLHNLASLPHITVAGACATATHGSGPSLGNLATGVSAIEFIDGRGDIVALSRERDGDAFAGAVVGLGALGAVTKMTLDAVPAFDMRQDIYRDLPMEALEAHFDAVMAAGYSVSLFTKWAGDAVEQVWVKSRVGGRAGAADLLKDLGAKPATAKLHPATGPDGAENCTEQMGIPGPSYDRLPHFRIDAIPATSGDHQAEYFVAAEHAVGAVRAMRSVGPKIARLLAVSEVRSVAADDLWLSPSGGRPYIGFHFSFGTNWPALLDVLPEIERALAPFDPVPHWGKLFVMSPEAVRARYRRLGDFRDLLATHDPDGRFRNAFVSRYIFGQG